MPSRTLFAAIFGTPRYLVVMWNAPRMAETGRAAGFSCVNTLERKSMLCSFSGFSKHAGTRMLTSRTPSGEAELSPGVFTTHPPPALFGFLGAGFGLCVSGAFGPRVYLFLDVFSCG